ncbi:hypothetical protein AC49_5393, partial [Escherichia coli 2-460-02_S3_C3]
WLITALFIFKGWLQQGLAEKRITYSLPTVSANNC